MERQDIPRGEDHRGNEFVEGTAGKKQEEKQEKTKEGKQDEKIPYTCSPAYDRSRCGSCSCASCYLQEFCDRCKDCQNQSLFKERCNAYEGALTY